MKIVVSIKEVILDVRIENMKRTAADKVVKQKLSEKLTEKGIEIKDYWEK